MPQEFNSQLKRFFSSIKRKRARHKLEGMLPVSEAREPMSWKVYLSLLLFFISTSLSPDAILLHFTLCFSWHLMCRINNTDKMCWAHLAWSGDTLVCTLPLTKTQQEGVEMVQGHAKHINSNPERPECCPILPLLCLLQHTDIPEGDPAVFAGGRKDKREQSSRFSRILTATVRKIQTLAQQASSCSKAAVAAVSAVGAVAGAAACALDGRPLSAGTLIAIAGSLVRIGTHSIRKGSSTFVSSRSTDGPSIVAVYQRAGWRMGGVLDRYLQSDTSEPAISSWGVALLCCGSSHHLSISSHLTSWTMPMLKLWLGQWRMCSRRANSTRWPPRWWRFGRFCWLPLCSITRHLLIQWFVQAQEAPPCCWIFVIAPSLVSLCVLAGKHRFSSLWLLLCVRFCAGLLSE